MMRYILGKGYSYYCILRKCSFFSSWNMVGKLSYYIDGSMIVWDLICVIVQLVLFLCWLFGFSKI